MRGGVTGDGRAGIDRSVKTIVFHFDVISPYAYLAFERLPKILEGIEHEIVYRPVVLGALLEHHRQLGPAEIPPKRDWTFRHTAFVARSLGIPFELPAAHPFNPLRILRLLVASAPDGQPRREAVAAAFHHVWRGGQSPSDEVRLGALASTIGPMRAFDAPDVKSQLRAFTDDAVSRRIFGVPMSTIDDKRFWGLEGLEMLRAYLDGDSFFASEGPWELAARLPEGTGRKVGER